MGTDDAREIVLGDAAVPFELDCEIATVRPVIHHDFVVPALAARHKGDGVVEPELSHNVMCNVSHGIVRQPLASGKAKSRPWNRGLPLTSVDDDVAVMRGAEIQ